LKERDTEESQREAKPPDVNNGSFRETKPPKQALGVIEGRSPSNKTSPFPLSRGRGIKVEDSSRGWGCQTISLTSVAGT